MRRIVQAYWTVLRGFRFRAMAAIVSLGLSGLLEGSALMFLVPILGQGISSTRSGDYGPLPEFLVSLIQPLDKGKISLFLGFILCGILSSLMKFLSEGLCLSVRNHVEQNLRRQLGQALFHVNWPSFLQLRLGDIGKSVVTETTMASEGCLAMINLLGLCLIVVFLICFSFFVSVPMTLITFMFGGLTGVLYYVGGRRALRHAQTWWQSTTVIAEKIGEMFNHLKHIRASGFTQRAVLQTEAAYKAFSASFFKSSFYKNILRLILECLAILLMAGFLAYGFFWSHERPEWIVVFLAIFYRLMPRINAIQDGLYTTGVYSVWLINVQDRIAALHENRVRPNQGEKAESVSRLDMAKASFHYPNQEKNVLQDISFSLQKGRLLLLLGESGSGKSTLLDLVLGLLELTQGQILLDGRPLSGFDLDHWRSRIGLVLQGSPVFHGSVLENIASFKEDPSADKAWACAEKADAAEFIRQLPEGMNTLLGEKGGRLSGGQRQRIALARALYRDPWLLILDEPTSELDEESQGRIVQTLRSLKPHYAILMSSHRTGTMDIADAILHLPSGRLEENPVHA